MSYLGIDDEQLIRYANSVSPAARQPNVLADGEAAAIGVSAPGGASANEGVAANEAEPARIGSLDWNTADQVGGASASDRVGLATAEVAAAAERFARAALTAIVEPGDTDAAVLVGALGPGQALTSIVTGWTCSRIIDTVGAADAASGQTLTDRIDAALERWRPRLSLRSVMVALDAAVHQHVVLVTPEDTMWPRGFGDLGDGTPVAVWVRGDPALLHSLERSVALVGARAATGYGEHVAMEAAAGLSDRGFATVSGGAYGIDGAVHRATLASDSTTIAFLAGGVDRLYPAGHTELLRRISDRGLLVGELPCGSSPTKWRFLQRNRLIAAAARATVVVEAGRRSGSLNTAGHAAAIGRPLGAVPGPVTSPASAGCHRLIREYGAQCVTDAAEIAELAGVVDAPTLFDDAETGAARPQPTDSAAVVRLLDALAPRSARSVQELAVRTGMSVRDVVATLGVLDIEGRVVDHGGTWVKSR